MKPLSPEARKALGALSASEPSASDEARVRQNLERTLGVVLPAAAVGVTTVATTATAAVTTTTTTSASAATGASITALGLGAKVTLFVAALTVGSVTTVAVRAAMAPSAPPPPAATKATQVTRPAPEPPAAAVARPVEEPPVVAEVEVTAAPEPVVTKTTPAPTPTKRPTPVAKLTEEPEVPAAVEPVPEPTAPPSAPPPPPSLATAQTQADFATVVELQFPTCDAAVEMRTAAAARSLLNEDRAPHALLLLSEYQRQCVSGQWSDEAWRVRLSSLCKLNRNKEATTLFEWFASEYPKRRQAIESELRVNCAPSVLGE